MDVPGFVSLVGEKRYAEALRLHRERNPLAAVCATVCFHPCENRCRRGKLDAPVAVRGVKRFMIEQEKKSELPEVRKNPANARRRVAIIGAGPAGLSCAYFLARLGYRPVIFEAEKKPGGMLVQTIPSYRLPRELLEREIRMIQTMGVTIKTGVRLGQDFTLKDLRDRGYEAVFLGVGAPLGAKLGIPGEEAEGVADGVKFLKDFNMRGVATVGQKVAVIGGGNVAVDVARTAVRLGAREVTVYYRRTREEMPAYAEEVEEAQREGVRFEFLLAPKEIVVRNGRAVGVRFARMQLGEFDRTGRRRPREIPGEDFVVEADQIVAAIGQTLSPSDVLDGVELKLGRGNWIEADPVTGQTSVAWIFAGGDAVTGPASVVEAIAAGERAAVGIDRYLTGEDHAFWRVDRKVDTAFDPDADPVSYARAVLPMLPYKRRTKGFEVIERPMKANVAVREAKRCLRCDYREVCEQ
ncbi:MAG: FAD-dependent oxidoreductase [Kiritimatiellae bacterium]|nr:FAD-dependent oxidoreductase [Kiritimatiellia bacterium]